MGSSHAGVEIRMGGKTDTKVFHFETKSTFAATLVTISLFCLIVLILGYAALRFFA